MAKKIETESVVIKGGIVSAVVKVGEGENVVGFNMAFRLKDFPALDALVPMIDSAIADALRETMGVSEVKS